MGTISDYLLAVDSSAAVTATALIITTLSILWYIRRRVANNYPPRPPGPIGLPIIGYLPFLGNGTDMHRRITKLAHRYGPIFSLHLGRKLFIVVDSSDLVKEMICNNGSVFENHSSTEAIGIVTYNFNDLIWAPYGRQRRDMRKLFAHDMLRNSSLEASYTLRREVVRKSINGIYTSRIATPIQFRDLAFSIQINVVINMICGGNIRAERREEIASSMIPIISRIAKLAMKPNISDFFPALAKFDVQGVREQMSGLSQRLDKIVSNFIDDWIKNACQKSEFGKGRTDFLQILLDSIQKPENKAWFGITQIKAMLIDMFIAGTDTLSMTVEWAMACLLQNPRVMEKVKDELNEVVGLSNIVEESHIVKLVYLDAVLKETLRLQPASPFSMRSPTQTCIVGGYRIPKDSTVYINIWSRLRDPLVWVNPLKFMPERFLDSTEKWNFLGNNNFNFIPFGIGKRICVGAPLAERMAKYVLSSFLHSFEWQIPDGEKLDMSEQLLTTLMKRIPLRVIAAPRLSDPKQYED